jgi:hypothetical protein
VFAIGTIDEWVPGRGSVVSWHPSAAALAKARQSPISAVPPSYQQARHLRSFSEQAARGLDHSRLLLATCKVGGRCDIRAMTYVINAHLRRRDTYRSWFEYQDAGHIVRHTIADPADIEFVPTEHGEMTPAELRDHVLATPDPLQWDCFRFGVIQGAGHFTVYASVDHLHADGQFVGVGLTEFQMMYATLVTGEAPLQLPEAGSYDDYCVRHWEYTSTLTLDSPQIRAWIEFAENNNGTFPEFPLPLSDPSVPRSGGDLLNVTLMDEQQTARFESACLAEDARFSGGLFACAALAEHQLTGAQTYYGLTPIDTRSTPAERMTQGWFTGLVPITVPVAAASFGAAARAAQASFDAGTELARVPFERVVELAPWLSRPRPLFPMLNYFEPGVGPLSPLLGSLLDGLNIAAFSDGRLTYPLAMLVHRFHETAVTVIFPKNPVAHESVARYLAAVKSVCARVADGRDGKLGSNLTQLPRQSA